MESTLTAQKAQNTDLLAKKFYIESYGCQMNFNDSEIVASILQAEGFNRTLNMREADLIMLNTCSIREKAEQTIRNRLNLIRGKKGKKDEALVAVLGCMAERLKSKLLEEEKVVDIVVGPDAYKSLPDLIQEAESGQKAVNVLLSREETYSDISPVRLDEKGVSAYVSIMRGCNNMCSFCVVPFTRGRERSRPSESIMAECSDIVAQGYKEITLLGQNVDSYHYTSDSENTHFADLLKMVASRFPSVRIRFSTSHPKDITKDVLYAMRDYENICKYIHLPVQSGSTRVLQLMNRTYTREWYIKKIDEIRKIMPDCLISSDIITGFCSETEEDHQMTLSIMEYSQFVLSYKYFYSERPGTLAARKLEDDVPLEIKKRRLSEVIDLQRKISSEVHQTLHGKSFDILLEGPTKKSPKDWYGRTSQNNVVVFPLHSKSPNIGDVVTVRIISSTSATLLGQIIDE